MKNYTLIVVSDPSSESEFLDFPSRLYKSDPNYIRPLDEEVKAIFDPAKNKLFRNGDAKRWLLKDDNNKTVGRIASFYNEALSRANDQPTGGIGFFDSINDVEASKILFDASREWLVGKGMEAMDGPINFGERDSFWGCLVDGFYPPIFNMPYNFPYYKDLFESYGFQNYFNQYTYHRLLVPGKLTTVVEEKAMKILNNKDYHFKTIDTKNTDKFIEDFMIIYNKAWARFPGIKKLSKAHAAALFKSLKPIMDPRLILYGYYKNEPVAFFIMMPDINQIIREFDGKLNMINKLKLIFKIKYTSATDKVIGRIFGVVPEHQGRGVEAGLIKTFEKIVIKPKFHYKDLEMNWIGDFNPIMMKVCEQIGATILKTHITYRYLFDRSLPFKRAKRVNV
ncbi:MAG TPA: hypothetical protein PK345_03700 [Bacteroidales bacterium]|jgi:hypothetical protein|nr:hypothetical protein [Bacteroidales bacterium]MBP7874177.1 hypothetical protein [Bacteroidales bacterium]MCZ2282728.1 hypothetical protein [Bacteroidales bacterium]HPX34158.1 hypothetical protein [Bacteroidales bacterium]HQB47458.1 hypothetical protein [Bacteroidales bacterium]